MSKVTLRGLVISTYGTIKKFADAMGWSYRKAAYIVGGRQEATASDIEKMADGLGIEVPELFKQVFFT